MKICQRDRGGGRERERVVKENKQREIYSNRKGNKTKEKEKWPPKKRKESRTSGKSNGRLAYMSGRHETSEQMAKFVVQSQVFCFLSSRLREVITPSESRKTYHANRLHKWTRERRDQNTNSGTGAWTWTVFDVQITQANFLAGLCYQCSKLDTEFDFQWLQVTRM